MPKLECCDRCLLYVRTPYLICAVHPTGIKGNECDDFRPDPTLPELEPWEPEGASYYNGELVLPFPKELTTAERLELLDTHPLFTGRCPECETPIRETDPPRVHWDCDFCGWADDSV